MLESMGVLSTAKVGRPRAKEAPLTKREAKAVAKKAAQTLGDALAPSTWKGLEGCHRRLLQFREEWAVTTGTLLPWDLCIIYWVQRLLSDRTAPIAESSALEYCSRAVSSLARMGTKLDSPLLRDFVRALKRKGGLRPHRQAKPATSEVVATVLEQTTDPDTCLAIAVAWCGAARVSDVLRLRSTDLSFEGGFVAINWSETKSDPFRIGVTTGVHVAERWMGMLRTKVLGLKAGELLVESTYRRVVAALQKVDPELSGHSLRRGALAELLEQGICLESLRQLSRHSSLDALARYLPAGKISLARDSATTSLVLGRRLETRGRFSALLSRAH